jgi:hypothetical protein
MNARSGCPVLRQTAPCARQGGKVVCQDAQILSHSIPQYVQCTHWRFFARDTVHPSTTTITHQLAPFGSTTGSYLEGCRARRRRCDPFMQLRLCSNMIKATHASRPRCRVESRGVEGRLLVHGQHHERINMPSIIRSLVARRRLFRGHLDAVL